MPEQVQHALADPELRHLSIRTTTYALEISRTADGQNHVVYQSLREVDQDDE